MGTLREHIEEIRRNKYQIGIGTISVSRDLRLAVKYLSTELYSKDLHFLMELIQVSDQNQFLLGDSGCWCSGVNPSPSAHLNNPAEERSKYKHDVDKEMTVLKFVDDEWGPVGSFNWFATHGTSMSHTNSLVSGDNKGAAARFMEDWFDSKNGESVY